MAVPPDSDPVETPLQMTHPDARPEEPGAGVPRAAAAVATRGSVAVAALGGIPVVAAHDGTAHAGTPHWILLAGLLAGIGTVLAGLYLGRTRWLDRPRLTFSWLLVGAVVVVVASVGLTELQIEPLGTDATPVPRSAFTVLAGGVGGGILVGTALLGLRRWSHRPSYLALGAVFGYWAAYPVLLPGQFNYWNPVGYALVVATPVLVGYVLWRDVWPALADVGRFERRFAGAVTALFFVFLLFSTGQFTFSPDTGVAGNLPDESVFIVTEFADPLVMWPAVEYYAPSVPVFAALSIGTVVSFGMLAALSGVNVALGTVVWRNDVQVQRSRGVLGGIGMTGASACCCCAPVVYSVAGAAVGVTASPLYWVFTDPASPLGDLFFVAAAGMMTASAVQLAASLDREGVCTLREEGGDGSGGRSRGIRTVPFAAGVIERGESVLDRLIRFLSGRRTLLAAAVVVAVELLIVGTYLLANDATVTEPLVLVYPFVWINVGVLAVVRASPPSSGGRYRRLAGVAAVGYFGLLAYFGGIAGLHLHSHSHPGIDFGVRIAWAIPPGYGPAVVYTGEFLNVNLEPYKLVGYGALAYLVYVRILDAAGSAITGVVGMFSCVSCTWPVLGTFLTGLLGGSSAVVAFATGQPYAASTAVFVSAVALLSWRPTV